MIEAVTRIQIFTVSHGRKRFRSPVVMTQNTSKKGQEQEEKT